MSSKLEIMDRTGHRTVIHPKDIAGELWIDDEYNGQFILHEGTMLLIHNHGTITPYIAGWSWVGERVGRG